jgi:hypothetical protein
MIFFYIFYQFLLFPYYVCILILKYLFCVFNVFNEAFVRVN